MVCSRLHAGSNIPFINNNYRHIEKEKYLVSGEWLLLLYSGFYRGHYNLPNRRLKINTLGWVMSWD
jgi:hypothetical protein